MVVLMESKFFNKLLKYSYYNSTNKSLFSNNLLKSKNLDQILIRRNANTLTALETVFNSKSNEVYNQQYSRNNVPKTVSHKKFLVFKILYVTKQNF